MIEIREMIEINSKKVKIITDNEIAFVVYKGDLRKYGMKLHSFIEEDVFERFVKEVLCPRAKKRGMYMLSSREYTVKGLEQKLQNDGYPFFVIEEAIAYLTKYHYLDDERYAGAFIRTYAGGRSRNEIIRKLTEKGIHKELAQRIYAEQEELGDIAGDKSVIKEILKKKSFSLADSTKEERIKMRNYLYRKGFSADSINAMFKEVSDFYDDF